MPRKNCLTYGGYEFYKIKMFLINNNEIDNYQFLGL